MIDFTLRTNQKGLFSLLVSSLTNSGPERSCTFMVVNIRLAFADL